MSYVIGSPFVAATWTPRLGQNQGQRGAIAGNDLLHPEPWKLKPIRQMGPFQGPQVLYPFTIVVGPIVLTAELATVASAGLTATLRERAQYALATVAAAGGLASLRERMQGAISPVGSAGLTATIPGQVAERFRNRVWDPVLNKAATKWKGFGRNPQ